MKKVLTKSVMAIVSVLIVLTMLATTAFAANTSEKTGLINWLSDEENTGFDFTDTSYLDTDICWTVFALEKADATAYSQYDTYINSVVENNYSSLFPSNLALIYLTAVERGQDTSSIGGHDILEGLKGVDYSSQTYISSLTYPLIALNYKNTDDCDDIKNTIIDTVLAAQQLDGGFPYCSVDTGFGISSDIDTTSMTVQALAAYYNTNAEVKEAVDKALEYIATQKFDDGSYGYKAYSSASADSTAQGIIALCTLGINPENSVDALKSYLDESGAAKDYSDTANTMSSYQTLLALVAFDNYESGKDGIYTFVEEISETTIQATESETTSDKNSVDIPKTGGKTLAASVTSLGVMVVGMANVIRKKK